ncbi:MULTISPECIES: hypothetical protein [unclassified Microbispora]|nr:MULTISPECIES: hypothetical protein [unclassified Microbispora]NJP28065.1 hypothetical protein [Microbispora sp. CL1-1]
MTDLTATADELLDIVRERFPREYEIAFLTLANRKQAERLAELERAAQQP